MPAPSGAPRPRIGSKMHAYLATALPIRNRRRRGDGLTEIQEAARAAASHESTLSRLSAIHWAARSSGWAPCSRWAAWASETSRGVSLTALEECSGRRVGPQELIVGCDEDVVGAPADGASAVGLFGGRGALVRSDRHVAAGAVRPALVVLFAALDAGGVGVVEDVLDPHPVPRCRRAAAGRCAATEPRTNMTIGTPASVCAMRKLDGSVVATG